MPSKSMGRCGFVSGWITAIHERKPVLSFESNSDSSPSPTTAAFRRKPPISVSLQCRQIHSTNTPEQNSSVCALELVHKEDA